MCRRDSQQVATSLRVLIFIAAPLTAAMIVLAEPITAVFFQYGLFSAQSTALTANALAFFAIGLVGAHRGARADARLLRHAGHAHASPVGDRRGCDQRAPDGVLVGPMGVEGLALALSVSASLEVIGLLWALHNRIESIQGGSVVRSAARSAVGAAAAALIMLGGLTLVNWLPALLVGGITRLLVVVVLTAAGAADFLLVTSALRSPEIALLRNLMKRRNLARA